MNDDAHRRKISAERLDEILAELAQEETTLSVSTDDLLDYAEGQAAEAAVARVHHALAGSPRLRQEFLEYLQELDRLDRHALDAAVAADSEVPVPPLDSLGRRAPRRVSPRRRWPRWGWAIAAAAALVLFAWPHFEGRPRDPFSGLEVLAAARGFEPEVVRGDAASRAVDAVLPPRADRVQLAVWIPESWVAVPDAHISATVIGPDGSKSPVHLSRLDLYDEDPAVLLVLGRPWLRPGLLRVHLRLEDAPAGDLDAIDAEFRFRD
jgi:hypothetical protein